VHPLHVQIAASACVAAVRVLDERLVVGQHHVVVVQEAVCVDAYGVLFQDTIDIVVRLVEVEELAAVQLYQGNNREQAGSGQQTHVEVSLSHFVYNARLRGKQYSKATLNLNFRADSE
jgi:hypothetical protein